MGGYAVDWVELAVRWIHVIAGVAWIGTSFYFNWLNDALEPAEEGPEALEGEAWEVHGGGFYRAQKFSVKLARLPERLHWFKWEAYGTWISGFAMLVLVYYLGAEVYMVSPSAPDLGPREAIAVGVGALVLSWLVYDRLCRSRLAERPAVLAGLGLVGLTALGWGLMQLLGDRAAYLHVGAAMGTMMAANVFRVIIPAHHELVDALEEDREPDPEVGEHAAMRSRHNNYLTLPVLFLMVSHHYPSTYGHEHGWALLAGILVIGAATRHHFNLRNQGRANRWLLPAAGVGLVALAWFARPADGGDAAVAGTGPGAAEASEPGSALFGEVRTVILKRCTPCHAEAPSHEMFSAPPAGLVLETPEQMRANAADIRTQAVELGTMPLGNFTGMTEAERALLDRWTRAAQRRR